MRTTAVDMEAKLKKVQHAMRSVTKRDFDPAIMSLPHFGINREEVADHVKLIHADAKDFPVVFSLWTDPDEIKILTNKSVDPNIHQPALLLSHTQDMESLQKKGIIFDTLMLEVADSFPGWRYSLFDYKDDEHLHDLLHDLIPSFGACVKMGID